MPPLNNTTPVSSVAEMEVDYDHDITRLYESITNEDWDVAVDAVSRKSVEARTWVVRHHNADGTGGIMWRFLPIHSACARQPPAELISALLEAYPRGASCEDDQGMFPLHYACGNQASSAVIRLLLQSYPDAAKMADPNGMLPIHYLAKWGPSSVGVVDMLLLANGDVSSVEAEGGMTPLDLAKEGEYPERDEVIEALKRQARASAAAEAASAPSPRDKKPMPTPTKAAPVKPAAEDDAAGASDADADPAKKSDDGTDATDESSDGDGQQRQRPVTPTRSFQPIASSSSNASGAPGNRAGTPNRRSKSPAADLGNKTTISKLVAQLEAVRKELADQRKEVQDLREDKRSRDEYVTYVEGKLAEKDEELTQTLVEKDEELEAYKAEVEAELSESRARAESLKAELAEVTERHDALLEKADDLNGHVIALTSSVAALSEDRDSIAAGLAEREERAKRAAQRRQKKLHELIDYEVELARVMEEEEKEGSLQKALERQREEMGAVAAILEAVNAKEDEMSVEEE